MVTIRQQKRYAICWAVNSTKWYFSLAHIVLFAVFPQHNQDGNKYLYKWRSPFSPNLLFIKTKESKIKGANMKGIGGLNAS